MANLKVGSLGDYIREQRRGAQISLRQLAESAGVSNPYLSQIERGLRKPSADILQQIAKGLRISSEALYVQAGILEDPEGDTEVPAAIRADPVLTERQKQVLVDIYDSFRRENRDAWEGTPAADEDVPRAGNAPRAGEDVPRAGEDAPRPVKDTPRSAAKEKRTPKAADVWDDATDAASEAAGKPGA